MKRRIRADEAFEQALHEGLHSASSEVEQLAKLAKALEPSPASSPVEPRFRARLRSELLAAAAREASHEEDLFAAMLDGSAAEAPAEMRHLVKVAAALEPDRLPVPNPGFRFRLRAQLVEAALPTRSPAARVADAFAAWNTRMRRNLRTVGAMSVALFMLLGAGASLAASRDALPGDMLYPLKRFQESAQLVGASGAGRGEKLLELAGVRLQEVEALVDRGERDQDLYVETLNEMDAMTLEGRGLILAAYRRTRDTASLQRLAAFASEQAADLTVLIDLLPPGARPVARDSLTLVDSIARDTFQKLDLACSVCPEGFVVPATGGAAGSGDGSPVQCACRKEEMPPGSSTGGTSPDGTTDPNGNGGTDPNDDDGEQNPPPPPEDDDVPDVPGTDIDDQLDDQLDDDLIDDLLDDLPVSPTPLPSPSVPALP